MLRIFKQYYPIRNIFFFIGEGAVIFFSILFASWIIIEFGSFPADRWIYFKILLITIVSQLCLYYNELYDLTITSSLIELGIRLIQALGVAAIILAGIYVVFPETIVEPGIFAISIVFVILFIVSWRFCYSLILTRGIFDQKIILLGSDDLSKKIIDEINHKKDSGYKVEVNIEEYPQNNASEFKKNIPSSAYKKDYSGLCELAEELSISKIIVALKERRGALPTKELVKCRVSGIEIIDGTTFYEMLTGKLSVDQTNPASIIFSEGFYKSTTKRFIKRAIDLISSVFMIVFLSPLIIVIAILIKIDSTGPVLFSQERVGKNRKNYMVYKFRSMVEDAEKQSGPVWAEDNDKRITRAGRFIRSWRLDEIPQLWNVLKGDMSLVGPRPEREFFVKKLEDIIPYFGQRFSVKPGITGWAQVCYRYGASVEDAVEKLNYDLFYIKNMSIFMDLMILLRTIKIVLFGKGAR
ncbi:MAG: TIGR03013 family PEP-CTERM/XrtA system glycosyltransferase [Deltaproteobacteria bacterium]|jgi:sugar transferase (PEP-CTERM system associated)|nr:TIGR03013 family PEP-CTERM/XrtA system glycosyltransferase [Deltaproteobacteria bacterium]